MEHKELIYTLFYILAIFIIMAVLIVVFLYRNWLKKKQAEEKGFLPASKVVNINVKENLPVCYFRNKEYKIIQRNNYGLLVIDPIFNSPQVVKWFPANKVTFHAKLKEDAAASKA